MVDSIGGHRCFFGALLHILYSFIQVKQRWCSITLWWESLTGVLYSAAFCTRFWQSLLLWEVPFDYAPQSKLWSRGTYSSLTFCLLLCAKFAYIAHQDLKAHPHFEKYKRVVEAIQRIIMSKLQAVPLIGTPISSSISFKIMWCALPDLEGKTHVPYLIGGTASIANTFIRYLNDNTGAFSGYDTSSDGGSTFYVK